MSGQGSFLTGQRRGELRRRPASPPRTFDDLSLERRRLIRIAEAMPFGRVLDLTVRRGEPQLTPLPKCIEVPGDFRRRDRPFASRATTLKQRWVLLFEDMSRRRDFVLAELVFQDGLPIRWIPSS